MGCCSNKTAKTEKAAKDQQQKQPGEGPGQTCSGTKWHDFEDANDKDSQDKERLPTTLLQSSSGSLASHPAPQFLPSSGGSSSSSPAVKKKKQQVEITPDGTERIVMVKYRMSLRKDAILGEGTSSICRRGVNSETRGTAVAIKVYKTAVAGGDRDVMMLKFRRQVDVLQQLQQPFDRAAVSDPTLWHEQLAAIKPSSLFMLLVDYSKDGHRPEADATDGVVYVITELAQYSLKDFLEMRRDETSTPLAAASVKSITRAILLIVAGLHAKGLVHMDFKPENIMMFNGRLKLIDVDGCVKIGTSLSIQDSSISFSPCYCAPEWAAFLVNEADSTIVVHPALDMWSVGMTICELVSLQTVLKPMYAEYLCNVDVHSHREAGFIFMDWLRCIKQVPLPQTMKEIDPDLTFLINDCFRPDVEKRTSAAQSLSQPYFSSASKAKRTEEQEDIMPNEEVKRAFRPRPRDDFTFAPLYKGLLWSLRGSGKPTELKDWLQRDMWLAQTGNLWDGCTWDGATLVANLANAEIVPYNPYKKGSLKNGVLARKPAFEIKYTDEGELASLVFATESQEDYDEWTKRLASAARIDLPTMQLGGDVAELRKYVTTMRNRK